MKSLKIVFKIKYIFAFRFNGPINFNLDETISASVLEINLIRVKGFRILLEIKYLLIILTV